MRAMSNNVRLMACSPQDVFDVLADGWLYPAWVVGASRMREVEEEWPLAGSRLHHSFGVWPALLNDDTIVEEWDPPRKMVIRPQGGAFGEALVTLEVRPRKSGCIVRIQEKAQNGPASLIPSPLLDVYLHARNAETLQRLAFLAEGQAA